MDEMKFDMSGAGSVLGAIRALAGMKAPVNVVGVIPACENMPGGQATKPATSPPGSPARPSRSSIPTPRAA